MNPALTMFGKTMMPLAASPSVLAVGVEPYKDLSAAWASDSKPSGEAARAGLGASEAMTPIASATTDTTTYACLNIGILLTIFEASACEPRGRAGRRDGDTALHDEHVDRRSLTSDTSPDETKVLYRALSPPVLLCRHDAPL